MYMFHAQTNLSKPIQNLGLRKVSTFLVLNSFCQITTIGIVHNDAEMTFFGFVGFAESHNIGMIEDLENLCLFQSLKSLFLRHFGNYDLLDYSKLFVRLALNKECFSKCSFSEELDLIVDFKGHLL